MEFKALTAEFKFNGAISKFLHKQYHKIVKKHKSFLEVVEIRHEGVKTSERTISGLALLWKRLILKKSLS